MQFINRMVVGFSSAAVVFAVSAADVSIDARSGVIPNDPSADVTVSTATGSGDGMTLGADKTTVSSLKQTVTTEPALVKIGAEQSLGVSVVSVAAGAQNLTLGQTSGEGLVTNASDTLSFDVADAGAAAIVNANLLLGSATLSKLGLGTVQALGGFCGTVSQTSGTMVYTLSQGNGSFSVESDDATYDYCSDEAYRGRAGGEPKSTAELKATETVVRATVGIPVAEFRVDGGTRLRVVDTTVSYPDVADYPEMYESSVPNCALVGSNSIGVVTFDGGGYAGKMIVAQGSRDYSKGAVYVKNGAAVRNICSVDGEHLLGLNGYAYLEVGGGSYVAEGVWQAGRYGALGIVVTNGSFTHPALTVRQSGFGFGGESCHAFLFVGSGGVFDGSGISAGVEIPIATATPDSVQVAVADGGVMNLGKNTVSSSGGVTYALLDGGTLRAAAVEQGAGSLNASTINFNGGVLSVTASSEQLFCGRVHAFAKGATIDVANAGDEVRVIEQAPVLAPTGKGVTAITVNNVLAEMTFVGPPAIAVTGNGKGAAAVCEFDAASGKVTGVRVTSPGVGYTYATAEVYYGSANKVTQLPVSLGACVSGGLTKSGPGTLLLEGGNTYTGATVVAGGTLKLGSAGAIKPASSMTVSGGAVLDLGGFKHAFSDYHNDGTGSVTNGTAEITGLVCDLDKVLAGQYDRLVMTNLSFTASASLKLLNGADEKLTRGTEYVLYEFVDGVPSRFPVTDPSSYENMSEAWGVVIRDRKAVLMYLGGSIFIYY